MCDPIISWTVGSALILWSAVLATPVFLLWGKRDRERPGNMDQTITEEVLDDE